MARRKQRSCAKQGKVENLETLARSAALHLEHRRFKEAAADYKRLLKDHGRQPAWVGALAQAYAGRAEHLASRGMIKEAIALWQTRAESCSEPLADPRYLSWLMAAGRTPELVRLYRQAPQALAGAGGVGGLQARLAAGALAGGGDLIAYLGADDPVARDFAAADAALEAYAHHDDAALEAALARISFRSPYRDFRQLMKALTRYEQAPGAAAEILARVPADTPFAGIREALEAVAELDTQVDTQPKVSGLPRDIVTVVAALAGWRPEQRQAVAALARLGSAPGTRALFDFVMNQRNVLGARFSREAAFALAGSDTRLHARLARIQKASPPEDNRRLVALLMEAYGTPWDAVDQWQRLLGALAAERAPDDDAKLRRALIHRHIADLLHPPQADPPLAAVAVDHLARSLELDPEDHSSYFRLIDHYLHVRDLKAARQTVDKALRYFPDDIECLFRAARTAVAGGAYKKATRFAERLLAIDPINSRVRGLLMDAYLAHARKQIKANKIMAARRELAHAMEWARSDVDQGRIQVLDGMITLTAEGREAACERLNAGITRAGGGLTGRFYLLLEAGGIGQNLQSLTRAANLPPVHTEGNREQVLALIQAVATLREDQQDTPAARAALQRLTPAINRAADAELDWETTQRICETLLRYKQHGPLKRYAQSGLRRWPKAPLLVFYRAMGRLEGRPPKPWEREFHNIDTAAARAYEAGDIRTAERIRAALDAAFPAPAHFDEFDPFADDTYAGGEAQRPAVTEGALDPALRSLLETILGGAELERLEAAIARDESIPPDIQARIEAFLNKEIDMPGAPQRKPKTPQKPKKPQRTNPFQDDLFGDEQ